jgi:sterol 3beta-glucosyltransferase
VKLSIISYGTRGDVQPFLCLAWALKERGHNVKLVGPKNVEKWVASTGVPFLPLPVDVQALFAAEAAQKMLAKGNIAAFFNWLGNEEKAYMQDMRLAIIDATKDSDAIITHALMEDRAAAIGVARKIPVLPVYFFPLIPSSTFASPFITTRNLGILNRLTHKMMLSMLWKFSKQETNAMRKELGIAPSKISFTNQAQQKNIPCVLAYSENIFSRPKDYGSNNIVTGGIWMPELLRQKIGEAGFSPNLSQWLDNGSPPVFLGFGSMPILDVEAMLNMTRKALKQVGARAVIGAGWSAVPPGGDETLFAVSHADHEKLFARCIGAVHHGGSGTTYASLRAGLPTFICSVFADQPFWGARCRDLGVGHTTAFSKLNAEKLVFGLKHIFSKEVQERARELGKKIAVEDGLTKVINIVENQLPNCPIPE